MTCPVCGAELVTERIEVATPEEAPPYRTVDGPQVCPNGHQP